MTEGQVARTVRFQSTLPVWGATAMIAAKRFPRDISIHAPRVGSDCQLCSAEQYLWISIHAPRVGSDLAHC